jgi:hypothetical protein
MRALMLGVALSALVSASAAACSIPALGAGIDNMLKAAALAPADLEKVRELSTQMQALAANGDQRGARDAEEQAMKLFGYRKAWLRCGPGTFAWQKIQPAKAPAM